jgi:hypothetical protein
MRRTIPLFLAWSVVLLSPPVVPGGARAEEPLRIVPASGGVEVEEIEIVRHSSPTAEGTLVPGANMSLTLWFPADWKNKHLSHHLIRIKSLDPIEDDTGNLLLTEEGRKDIDYLRDEQRARYSKQADGKAGPVVTTYLDGPARRAETIKAIKGKAEVSLAKEVSLTFKDLDALNGKELDHPDFPALRDMKLKFWLTPGFFAWTAQISAPDRFDWPGNFGRLDSWEVLDGGVPVTCSRREETLREFTCGTVKRLSLRLVVLEPVESKTFDFDFRNVPLP